MIVLVCGSRDWIAEGPIRRELTKRKDEISLVIDGAARGADTLAYTVATSLGLPTRRFPANWNVYGRKAGMIRNQAMLDIGKPDLVLAFHKDITLLSSKGTMDMVKKSLARNIPVLILAN